MRLIKHKFKNIYGNLSVKKFAQISLNRSAVNLDRKVRNDKVHGIF